MMGLQVRGKLTVNGESRYTELMKTQNPIRGSTKKYGLTTSGRLQGGVVYLYNLQISAEFSRVRTQNREGYEEEAFIVCAMYNVQFLPRFLREK